MTELRNEYQKEQMSKAELAHELQVLKEQYEKIKDDYILLIAFAAVDIANSDLDTMEGLDPSEAARKLEQLQQQFVGGEQVRCGKSSFHKKHKTPL
ncbi:unnamed protein product [Cylicostephanus goldi]|uniref:Uncharacterized protein n=1 Tax=Cylicostephanus goldi TaxID=71465 RepID=A0A3P6TXH4_CYLGO|nr:unnamed protein product [Cylicostephanus goldi]